MKFNMKEQGFETEVPYGKLQVWGNELYGYRPYQLLVAAVAVCSGGVLRKILDKMRNRYSNITITTEIERNKKEKWVKIITVGKKTQSQWIIQRLCFCF